MIKRKHLMLGFLAFCLTATLFIGITTSGTSPSIASPAEYDPWCDVNDDGIIDIVDIVNLAIRFGEKGTPVDKAAIAYNSTVVYDDAYTTSYPWVDMPGTNVTITITRPSDLLIMFSAEARTNNSDGRMIVCAMVDGYDAEPDECYFTPTVSTTGGHSHTLDYMACAFNFLYYNASAGTHTVKMQWGVQTYQTEGSVYYRTLAVMAVNQ